MLPVLTHSFPTLRASELIRASFSALSPGAPAMHRGDGRLRRRTLRCGAALRLVVLLLARIVLGIDVDHVERADAVDLHDGLPLGLREVRHSGDRKSTRLNSSH